MGLLIRVLLLRTLILAVLLQGLFASPAKKGHPKSIPHHAAHILADPNHNSPRLLSLPTAQRLVGHQQSHGGYPLSGHGGPYHPDDPLYHNSNYHPDYYNSQRGPPYNNRLYHNSIGGARYPSGSYHNGLGPYNNAGHNGFGYNPYGVHPGGSYYIQLPDGRVEETSRVAAQLGYYPAGAHHDPYRG